MTDRQKQLLLAYLGYEPGPIDGIWGKQTQGAWEAFLAVFPRGDLKEAVAMDHTADPFRGIRYFEPREFACRCGTCGGFPAKPERKLLETADRLREKLGTVDVTSGVRCEKHNAAVGGVKNSRHLTGKAMDFRVRGKDAAQVLSALKGYPIRYAYAIDAVHVHMDVE